MSGHHNKQIIVLCFMMVAVSSSCQNMPKVKTQLFEANTMPEAFDPIFWDTLRTSYWYDHHFYRFAGDTSVSAILSMDQKVLYVETFHKKNRKYQHKAIVLDEKCAPIHHIFYHNNDSIFVILHRFTTLRDNPDWADILLLDGNGNLLRSYRLDDMPFIRKSDSKRHTLAVNRCCNQMMGHELLFWLTPYQPHMCEAGYKDFNPPLAAALNVQTGGIRMLNIRCPESLMERKFTNSQSMWIKKLDNNNLLVGFECSPMLYLYSMREDSMRPIKCHYSTAFSNTDSASMTKGKDYTSYDFFEPNWVGSIHGYARMIWISNHAGYRTIDKVTELMDSNFNHISYVVGNENYRTPVPYRGDLIAMNKLSKRNHAVSLRKRKRVPLRNMMLQVMEKLPETEADTIHLQKYLTELGVPRKSIVFIINLKYPCGECMDFLFSLMEKHRDIYTKNHVYYVAYDPDKSGLLEALLKRNNLEHSENILEDNALLKNVYLAGAAMGDGQFFAIDFFREDSTHIAVTPLGFGDLKPFFERLNKKLNK